MKSLSPFVLFLLVFAFAAGVAGGVNLVDSCLSTRDAVDRLIRSLGIDVESFGSGEEFLQCYESDTHGCLVLEVRLPGMSGLDLQSRLARTNCQIPTVFVTAYGDISEVGQSPAPPNL